MNDAILLYIALKGIVFGMIILGMLSVPFIHSLNHGSKYDSK